MGGGKVIDPVGKLGRSFPEVKGNDFREVSPPAADGNGGAIEDNEYEETDEMWGSPIPGRIAPICVIAAQGIGPGTFGFEARCAARVCSNFHSEEVRESVLLLFVTRGCPRADVESYMPGCELLWVAP